MIKGLLVFPLEFQTFWDLLHSHDKSLQQKLGKCISGVGGKFFFNHFFKIKINKCLPLKFTHKVYLIGKVCQYNLLSSFSCGWLTHLNIEILILAWKSNFAQVVCSVGLVHFFCEFLKLSLTFVSLIDMILRNARLINCEDLCFIMAKKGKLSPQNEVCLAVTFLEIKLSSSSS